MPTEIHKLFGGSTPDGLGYQFRAIKKGGDVLTQAAANGGDPAEAYAAHMFGGAAAAGSGPATPSQRTPSSAIKRAPSANVAGSRSGATPATKRRKRVVEEELEPELDDDEDSDEQDYSELDDSPSKQKAKKLTTPKKFGPLVPHSAWAKPAGKTPVRRRNVPIAPAPPRAVPAQPYMMAPIPGVAVPNGYTNPATGVGYNSAPPPTMSASPSVANSPAMEMSTMRRGSIFSTGSFSSGSRPGTPTMGFPPQQAANTTTQQYHPAPSTMGNDGMSTMNTTRGMVINTNMSSAPVEPNHNLSTQSTGMTNMPSFSMDPFHTATSPAPSVSDAYTPQTSASSNTMGSSMHAAETATSFQADQSYGGYRTANNGPQAGANADSSSFNITWPEGMAAGIDFGSFSDQERDEREEREREERERQALYDAAGDC